MTKPDSSRPLFASKTGRSSHTVSIHSTLGLRFCFRLWADLLHWKTSCTMGEFSVSTWVTRLSEADFMKRKEIAPE